jgi:hypothetical protein
MGRLPYTWENRIDGRHNVKVRLDRALADGYLLNLFGDSSMQHVQITESDHCVMLIHLHGSEELGQCDMGKPFWYENMWQHHENYEATIVATWTTNCNSLLDVGPL